MPISEWRRCSARPRVDQIQTQVGKVSQIPSGKLSAMGQDSGGNHRIRRGHGPRQPFTGAQQMGVPMGRFNAEKTLKLSNRAGQQVAIETTYSQAREGLKGLMDRAVQDREVVMVRRRKGGDVALVAADELAGLMETAHLLRSPANAERLLTALSRAREQSLDPINLTDLVSSLEG